MDDGNETHIGKVRVTVDDCYVNFRVIGESNEPDVRESLNAIKHMSEKLTAEGAPHLVYERKTAGGGYEPDCVRIPLCS